MAFDEADYRARLEASYPSGIELRAQRRAQKLEQLSDPELPLRGKKRPSSRGINPEKPPRKISEGVLRKLQDLLGPQEPLMDTITAYGRPEPNYADIDAYAQGAAISNRKIGKTKDERRLIDVNRALAYQHAHDILQRNLRIKTFDAKIGHAAIASVRRSIAMKAELHPAGSLYAAAAIEDFGQTLPASRPDLLFKIGRSADRLARDIEHTGAHAVYVPEVLVTNLPLLRVVQMEQVKREQFWGTRLAVSEQMMDRSTDEIRESVAFSLGLIAELDAYAEAA